MISVVAVLAWVISSTTVTDPPGVNLAALGHDGQSDVYRVPSGVVSPGGAVTIRFRTAADGVDTVTLRLTDQASSVQRLLPMRRVARAVSCYQAALATSRCDFWQVAVRSAALGVLSYRFVVRRGEDIAYYADSPAQFGAVGAGSRSDAPNDYRIHIVTQRFPVVPAMKDGVMYQIMPDRFDNGDSFNDISVTRPRYDYPVPANPTPAQAVAATAAKVQRRVWTELPEGSCRDHVNSSVPCTELALGRDYFGGDLPGITQKLPYLQRLGVTIIYLTPVFASKSNHAYDVEDFTHVDPAFGGDAGLATLLSQAHRLGIRVILDLPFDPSSSDSPYFDRYHHYPVTGACEDPKSPYRSWFTFHNLPAGTAGPCAGEQPGGYATYDGWGGAVDTLPLFRKKDRSDPVEVFSPIADYFYRGQDSIAHRWLAFGVDGFRLDSMQDESFPPAYWQQFRTVVKAAKPDAPLVGEGWQFADNLKLTRGDQADTSMGYRFRAAVLSLLGAVGDDKKFPGDGNPNVPVSQFVAAMRSIRQDYPDATYRTFMNLLGSHDTARLRWILTPGQYNREDREFNAANVVAGIAAEKVAATIQFTVPGMPSIYYGDEVGVTGSDDPDNRRTFPWTSTTGCAASNDYCAGGDHDLLSFYSALVALRKSHPVFRDGDAHYLLVDDQTQTLVYAMRTRGDMAIVLINRSTAARTVNVPTAAVVRDGVDFVPALGREAAAATTEGGRLGATIPAMTAQVLVARPGQRITPPPAPRRVRAGSWSRGQLRIDWDAVGSAASYQISRSPLAGGGYQMVGTVTQTSFVDTLNSPGTDYHYVVKAVDRSGNVGDSSADVAAIASPSLLSDRNFWAAAVIVLVGLVLLVWPWRSTGPFRSQRAALTARMVGVVVAVAGALTVILII
jgi:glycosidase